MINLLNEPGFDAWGRSVNFFDVNDDGLEDIFLSDHGYDAPPFPELKIN